MPMAARSAVNQEGAEMINHGDILGREIGTLADTRCTIASTCARSPPCLVGRAVTTWRRPFPHEGLCFAVAMCTRALAMLLISAMVRPALAQLRRCSAPVPGLALGHGRLFRQGIEAPFHRAKGQALSRQEEPCLVIASFRDLQLTVCRQSEPRSLRPRGLGALRSPSAMPR